MFDLTSSKLLILGIVALIVVGPKDLPILLRTIGKYMGMIRRQANEFKSQFDDAMRESELDSLKREVENVGRDVQSTMRDAEMSIERDMKTVDQDVDRALTNTSASSASETPAEPIPVTEAMPAPNLDTVTAPAKTGT